MQEQATFQLSNDFIRALGQDHENKNELFSLELKANQNILENLLGGYHFASRGKVYDYSIVPSSLEFTDCLQGQFKMIYSVMHVNGCQDLTYSDTDNKQISFKIDLENKSVLLVGETVPERLPDEI